jgi:hypothetical protein
MRARIFLGFLLLLAPLVAAGAALAQSAQPLDRLLPQIRRDHPGQFLDAEGFNSGGNPHYHLKWLTPDGRVLWLDTDARTGRVVGQSSGRDGFDGPRYRAQENDLGARDEGRQSQDAPRYDNSRPSRQQSEPLQYGRRFDGRGDAYGRQYGNGRFSGGAPGGQRFNGGGNGNRGFGGGRDRGGR